uniref:Uncharacterized protein n=1 Tax=Avena sativa TaxID=4498 RepID=A0ACD5YDI6_AVESA
MMMTGRGSPRINLMQAKVVQKNLSPKGRVTKKRSKDRASWNAELEKSLVDLLHEHNTPQYKGQNGWSSDAWNKIVKRFQASHPYVTYTKGQIQDKEKELKRVYKMLKEARKQSGASWNDKRSMIEAEEALWDNLIISFPKIGKFRTKAFPLFDALGELYDGQTAEGTYNFTSTQQSKQPTLTEVEFDPEVSSVEVIQPHIGDTMVDVEADTQGGMQDASFQANPIVAAAPSTSTDSEPKRRRSNADVAAMMEKYIEMKTKQIEDTKADSRNVDEFSIKNCIARLSTMEFSQDEKVKALRVFKSADNRELFICTDLETAAMWLRSEMA